MDSNKLFFDERLKMYCVYCGDSPSTRDHVPSKVLLDKPYPDNLPVVQSCQECNNSLSEYEPYFACAVECVAQDTTAPEKIMREKVKRILKARTSVRSSIESDFRDASGRMSWKNNAKIVKIILKLARGHAFYEIGELLLEEPEIILCSPVDKLSSDQILSFETPPETILFPEIGSRAFRRAFETNGEVELDASWRIVQPGGYRYLVSVPGCVVVRIVFSEYLMCEVVWSN